jgi:predicted RND superfamily exporter protein
MKGTGRAIVFDATANALGFVTFIFSGFAPIRTLGVLVCFTMLSCLVLTLLVIPAVIAIAPVPFRHRGKGAVCFRLEAEPEEAILASNLRD